MDNLNNINNQWLDSSCIEVQELKEGDFYLYRGLLKNKELYVALYNKEFEKIDEIIWNLFSIRFRPYGEQILFLLNRSQ